MIEKIISEADAPRPSKKSSHEGIKAIISVSDLQSILFAAKQWQDLQVKSGKDASRLLHHIANAEKVMVKFKRRKELACQRRHAERMAKDAEIAGVAPTVSPLETISAGEKPTNSFGDALSKVLGAFKGGDTQEQEAPKTAKKGRPTRW